MARISEHPFARGPSVLNTPPFSRDFELDELIAAERQKTPGLFLDFGPPLPSSYGVDRLHLMVQSPEQVFAYWEMTGGSVRKVLSRFPAEDRQGFSLMLRWRQSGKPGQRFDIGTTHNWWFSTSPDSFCEAELALYSEDWGWISLLGSNVAHTPRNTLCPPSPSREEPEGTEEFLQDLVRQTGLAQPDIIPEPVEVTARQQEEAVSPEPGREVEPPMQKAAVGEPPAEAPSIQPSPPDTRQAGSWSLPLR
jgi:hypothetical protein